MKDEHEAEAEPGAKGQFDVFAEKTLIFSKQEAGRFPQLEEIRALLS